MKKRVVVLYHFFPHYRRPILEALSKSKDFDFSFIGSHQEYEGIVPFTGNDEIVVHPLKMSQFGRFLVLSGYSARLREIDPEAVIILGSPNIINTAWIAVLSRLSGRKTAFWAHGWLKSHYGLAGIVRNFYFSLANLVFVYANRARTLAANSGFKASSVVPIYNSLDWQAADLEYGRITAQDATATRAHYGAGDNDTLLICTARLTAICRLDLLIRAAAMMAKSGRKIVVLLVGAGPEKERLQALADGLGVTVHLPGAIYDESILARLIYSSDACVSPGKVGLTAMHSLSYGTPVVTHGNLDHQMPEVEAITDGTTGAFFEEGDPTSLASAIERVITSFPPRDEVRALCRAVIRDRYTPERQREIIEDALNHIASERPRR